MHPLYVSLAVFIVLFGAAMLGLRLRARLPEAHRSDKTEDAVRVGMGSVATMAALVLGLLVASTKEAYDTEKSELIELAADIVCLDQVLANYGPETAVCRKVLLVAAQSTAVQLWPEGRFDPATISPTHAWGRELPRAIQELSPATEAQKTFQSQATDLAGKLCQTRWLLYEQAQTSISTPLLVMMVFWMAMTYASAGLFAPPNGTVVTAQFFAALAVAGALFLIMELDDPYSGLIRISGQSMTNALHQLGK